MAAFGITAICPSTSVADVHVVGYETERTSGSLFYVLASSLLNDARFRVTAVGDVIPGPYTATDLATTATEGFLYLRSGDGPPTGVPANAGNGRVATYYDRTNEKLYVYNGGWVGVTLA